MNPKKVKREQLEKLTDLPNIGKSLADDLRLIGIQKPEQLIGKDAFDLYSALCNKTNARHDSCVLDVFMSIVRFMNGESPKFWWEFTEERKQKYGAI